jgi:cysteinyl-tRNA synthetase
MALKVYNSVTRKKEEFKSLHRGFVGMYVCGPTVYGDSHLGHAKSYVSFDAIVRYLRYLGYKVLYVQNITDVGHLLGDVDEGEDRIVRQSKLEHKHPMEIAETYTRSYFQDMDALNILRPDISPRATGHITEQLGIIEQLLRKGLAYEANGSVYFDVHAFVGYGKLSGRSVEEMEAGARVAVKTEKKHPADFALWKKAVPEHVMRWPSPWGDGFPGWHVECSAMSMKYLGDSFDIHGGGLENIFPHHECEIAQSEGATGKPFVKYWMHNNMVTVDGRKMGKSLGNFTTLKDAFTKWRPEVIRFFILQSHYRSTLDFSADAVDGAAKGLEKLTNTLVNLQEKTRIAQGEGTPPSVDLVNFKTAFLSAMDDDFNTPRAVAILFDLAREVNHFLGQNIRFEATSLENIHKLFLELGGEILGVLSGAEKTSTTTDGRLEGDLVNLIIDLRQEVRAKRMWPLADKIRNSLAKLGIALEDKTEGTSWRKIS